MSKKIIHKKHFSQNFINNKEKLLEIVDLIKQNTLNDKDIIEIGPGSGILTEEILKLNKNIISIEIDRDLSSYLNEKFQNHDNFTLINRDILDFLNIEFPLNLNYCSIIGNLPYNIGTKIILKLTENRILQHIQSCVFMLQKEVVDRLLAIHNSKQYGRISIIMQSQFHMNSFIELKGVDFFPKVKVDSSVFVMRPKVNRLSDKEIDKLSILTKILFSSRRKKVSSILKNHNELLTKHQVSVDNSFYNKRPEEISVDEYINMIK